MAKNGVEKDDIGIISNDTALEKQRRKTVRRKRVIWIFCIVLFFVMILVVAIVFSKFFFSVRNIEIDCGEYYDPEEVEEVAGVKKGDILFTVDTDAVARKIETELPHAISVKVERDYPGTLRISMQQTEAEFCFEISGQYVVVSKELKVLCVLEGKEELESSYGPLIPIKIPPIRNAVAGHTLVFMDERDTDFIPELLYTIEVCKLRDKITSIDASVRFDIRLFYMDRLEIKLGNTEEFETKLIFARQIAEKFKEGTTGTISVEDPEEGFALVDQPENLIP